MGIGHFLFLEAFKKRAASSGRSPVHCYTTVQMINHFINGASQMFCCASQSTWAQGMPHNKLLQTFG